MTTTFFDTIINQLESLHTTQGEAALVEAEKLWLQCGEHILPQNSGLNYGSNLLHPNRKAHRHATLARLKRLIQSACKVIIARFDTKPESHPPSTARITHQLIRLVEISTSSFFIKPDMLCPLLLDPSEDNQDVTMDVALLETLLRLLRHSLTNDAMIPVRAPEKEETAATSLSFMTALETQHLFYNKLNTAFSQYLDALIKRVGSLLQQHSGNNANTNITQSPTNPNEVECATSLHLNQLTVAEADHSALPILVNNDMPCQNLLERLLYTSFLIRGCFQTLLTALRVSNRTAYRRRCHDKLHHIWTTLFQQLRDVTWKKLVDPVFTDNKEVHPRSFQYVEALELPNALRPFWKPDLSLRTTVISTITCTLSETVQCTLDSITSAYETLLETLYAQPDADFATNDPLFAPWVKRVSELKDCQQLFALKHPMDIKKLIHFYKYILRLYHVVPKSDSNKHYFTATEYAWRKIYFSSAISSASLPKNSFQDNDIEAQLATCILYQEQTLDILKKPEKKMKHQMWQKKDQSETTTLSTVSDYLSIIKNLLINTNNQLNSCELDIDALSPQIELVCERFALTLLIMSQGYIHEDNDLCELFDTTFLWFATWSFASRTQITSALERESRAFPCHLPSEIWANITTLLSTTENNDLEVELFLTLLLKTGTAVATAPQGAIPNTYPCLAQQYLLHVYFGELLRCSQQKKIPLTHLASLLISELQNVLSLHLRTTYDAIPRDPKEIAKTPHQLSSSYHHLLHATQAFLQNADDASITNVSESLLQILWKVLDKTKEPFHHKSYPSNRYVFPPKNMIIRVFGFSTWESEQLVLMDIALSVIEVLAAQPHQTTLTVKCVEKIQVFLDHTLDKRKSSLFFSMAPAVPRALMISWTWLQGLEGWLACQEATLTGLKRLLRRAMSLTCTLTQQDIQICNSRRCQSRKTETVFPTFQSVSSILHGCVRALEAISGVPDARVAFIGSCEDLLALLINTLNQVVQAQASHIGSTPDKTCMWLCQYINLGAVKISAIQKCIIYAFLLSRLYVPKKFNRKIILLLR